MRGDRVVVSLVTWNDAADLGACLDSVAAQTLPVSVRIHDNASLDATAQIARASRVEVRLHPTNSGYAAGHNLNLKAGGFDYALLLNADVRLAPDYIERLLEAVEPRSEIGLAGGKLLRMDSAEEPAASGEASILDSAGIYFTPAQRHFDRGGGLPDQGQYDVPQLVFGVTGAALLCRRSLVDDLEERTGEFLDEDFFAYREDAELAWRARITGWEALYVPRARAFHRRQARPGHRRDQQPVINYHSVKNRYLMRMKNMGPAVRRRCFPYAWLRDAGIFAYLCLFERSSLPALRDAWTARERFRAKRARLEAGRRISDSVIAGWFSFTPQARDLDQLDEPGGK